MLNKALMRCVPPPHSSVVILIKNWIYMTNHIQIGKSIVKNYSDYATTETIDDRAEYFPTLRVIIKGIIESDTDKKEQKEIEKVLIEPAHKLKKNKP